MAQLGSLTPEIRRFGVEPLAVAVTATFSQIAFAERLGVDFPMLSDWEGEIAHAYGVQYDTWKGHSGLAKRSVFLVDVDQTIRYSWVSDDALIEPDFDEVLDVIRGIWPG